MIDKYTVWYLINLLGTQLTNESPVNLSLHEQIGL